MLIPLFFLRPHYPHVLLFRSPDITAFAPFLCCHLLPSLIRTKVDSIPSSSVSINRSRTDSRSPSKEDAENNSLCFALFSIFCFNSRVNARTASVFFSDPFASQAWKDRGNKGSLDFLVARRKKCSSTYRKLKTSFSF